MNHAKIQLDGWLEAPKLVGYVSGKKNMLYV